MPHDTSDLTADHVVIGGGIVGLATAWALKQKFPNQSVAVLEKEEAVARHQTGRNSGVVHSGIYYAPGSLKATLCRQGVGLLKEFCLEHGIAYEECGKVIVAADESELPALERLYERGTQNGVPGLRLLDGAELKEIEPHVNGVRAIHSPTTAMVDYVGVANKLVELLRGHGAEVLTGATVTSVENSGSEVIVSGPGFRVAAGFLVNCAGLHSDRIARLSGAAPAVRIVPFRGEYYVLRPERRHLVRTMIYPVPNAALPFLGVHFTRMVGGEVEAGPNAVLALAREGYTLTTVKLADSLDTASYGGFWRLARRFWRVGAYEVYRSLSKTAFVRSLQRLVPEVTADDLERGPAGVRAQAVDASGRLVDDFAFAQTPNALHVLNAPSPAATASLAIGRHVAALAGQPGTPPFRASEEGSAGAAQGRLPHP